MKKKRVHTLLCLDGIMYLGPAEQSESEFGSDSGNLTERFGVLNGFCVIWVETPVLYLIYLPRIDQVLP